MKKEITSGLLDEILKDAWKNESCDIGEFLSRKGYDKSLASGIKTKLIKDGYAVLYNDGGHSIRISTNGVLLLNDGGYVRKRIKEYIPPVAAIIGCITGTGSLIWHILTWFFG